MPVNLRESTWLTAMDISTIPKSCQFQLQERFLGGIVNSKTYHSGGWEFNRSDCPRWTTGGHWATGNLNAGIYLSGCCWSQVACWTDCLSRGLSRRSLLIQTIMWGMSPCSCVWTEDLGMQFFLYNLTLWSGISWWIYIKFLFLFLFYILNPSLPNIGP